MDANVSFGRISRQRRAQKMQQCTAAVDKPRSLVPDIVEQEMFFVKPPNLLAMTIERSKSNRFVLQTASSGNPGYPCLSQKANGS